jgi:sigma-B regulation protein RsbU (phosphoserine phosphatase)
MAALVASINRPRLMIADDQADVRDALRLALRPDGYAIEQVLSPAAVLEAVREHRFDLALLDLNYARDTTSGREGLDLIDRVREIDADLPIVVMTGWASIELAVEALQHGAGDFVQKPWENSALRAILRTQLERGLARREARVRERQNAREWAEASSAQKMLLPQEIPPLPGFELAAASRPAGTLSGDYYEVLSLGEGRALLCIGDVCGKGAGAALLMANLQAAVKACAQENVRPAALCRRVNSILCENCEPGRFVTLFCAVLDTTRKTLTYVNAGHNPPLVARSNGSLLKLGDGGPVLGEFTDWSAAQGEIELLPGDRLILYTDGVTEAANSADEEFGEERLARFVCAHRALSAAELHARALAESARFAGGAFSDDVTLLVLAAQ